MEMLCLQKIRYMNYITYIMKIRGLSMEDLCVEKYSTPPVWIFFWNSLFELVFLLNFTFAVATVMLRFHDSVLILSYISCLQKSIYLVHNDSSDICPCFSYMIPLLFAGFP